MDGFGGAFTDSTGINCRKLSNKTCMKLIESCYSETEGLGYVYGRIPMAATDFSDHLYTYDDLPESEEDLDMKKFALAPEDFKYKIPLIKAAQKMAKQPLKLFAAPWFAPGWIKESGHTEKYSYIKGQPGGPFYKAWAKYHVKFLKEYGKNGVNISFSAAQNQPYLARTFGNVYNFSYTPLTGEQLRDFIVDLGQELKREGLGSMKITVPDEYLLGTENYTKIVLAKGSKAAPFVSIISIHAYIMGPEEDSFRAVANLHRLWPSESILMTEYCSGGPLDYFKNSVLLGNWERAENLTTLMIKLFKLHVSGWVDWNLCLDDKGGPNWMKNYVDSSIIVNPKNDEFFKQPLYYAIGHFSKFLAVDSVFIGTETKGNVSGVDYIAAIRPDNVLVAIVSNRRSSRVNIKIQKKGGHSNGKIAASVPPRSIATFLFR